MSAITITNVGRTLFRNSLSATQNIKITYVALGSGTNAPTTGDTQLQTEVFRKKITSYTNGGTGEVFINMYLSPSDAQGADIEEVGFFGGNATATPNSGVLLARGLYSHPSKTNLESITFALDFTIS